VRVTPHAFRVTVAQRAWGGADDPAQCCRQVIRTISRIKLFGACEIPRTVRAS